MFEGFTEERVKVGEVTLRVRHGGSGPAVLLIHGHPRTSATWHRVAPALVVRGFSVVCADMRGYGQSNATFAETWFHWFFFAQPDRPEQVINRDPDSWYGGAPSRMGQANFAEYRSAIHDPEGPSDRLRSSHGRREPG